MKLNDQRKYPYIHYKYNSVFLSTAVCSTKKQLYLKFAYLKKDAVPYVEAPRRKEVWVSEDKGPLILNLRIECLLNFTLRRP